MQQEGAADVGIEVVLPAIAVVVTHSNAHSVAAVGRAHSRAHCREGPGQRIGATVVAKELGAYRPVRAVVDEEDIQVAVVVVVRPAGDEAVATQIFQPQ